MGASGNCSRQGCQCQASPRGEKRSFITPPRRPPHPHPSPHLVTWPDTSLPSLLTFSCSLPRRFSGFSHQLSTWRDTNPYHHSFPSLSSSVLTRVISIFHRLIPCFSSVLSHSLPSLLTSPPSLPLHSLLFPPYSLPPPPSNRCFSGLQVTMSRFYTTGMWKMFNKSDLDTNSDFTLVLHSLGRPRDDGTGRGGKELDEVGKGQEGTY